MKLRGRTGSRAGTGMAHTVKIVGAIPLLLLALAAWAVALAGVSVVRHAAGNDNVFGDIGFTWFVIAGSLVVLLAALVHVAGLGLSFAPIGHSGIAGLLAVFTTLTMLETNKWNTARKATPYSTQLGKGAVTAFAGFLVLSVANALLILVLGNSTSRIRNGDTYAASQVHQNPVAPAAAPVAPAAPAAAV